MDGIATEGRVRELLAHLDDRAREIVEMRFLEDVPQPEIATRLQLPRTEVARILRTALGALYERVERQDA